MYNFIKNYLSTILFLILIYFFYLNIPFYKELLIKDFSLNFLNISINSLLIYKTIIFWYILLLIPFYIYFTEESKARITINYIKNKFINVKYKLKEVERVAFFSWIIKAFFAPLMIIWLTWHVFTMINNIYLSYNDISIISKDFLIFFNKHFFWYYFILWCIIFYYLIFNRIS